MPKTTLIVLKLGGSVITTKDSRTGAVRRSLVQRVGKVIAAYLRHPKRRLVLLHGAGAPGHRLAQRYDLASGVRGNAHKKAAALRGQKITATLNHQITQLLKQSGVPAVTIAPPTIIAQRSGKLQSLDTTTIKKALQEGLVPVLYGDIVPDSTWGMSICSADVSGAYLARILKADRLLFATDTDGIYSDDPHYNRAAQLIHTTTRKKLAANIVQVKKSHSHDVTGGMRGKINSILSYTRGRCPQEIVIFNGRVPQRYAAILKGTRTRATHIK